MWGCPLARLRAHSRPENGAVQQETTEVHRELTGFTEWSAVMDYDKMKALMGASRDESSSQRKPEVTELSTWDSRPDWKYLDYVAKERIAA